MATPVETVTAFFAEWDKSSDAIRAAFRRYFMEATVWENVGVSTTTGVDEALALMDSFETGFGLATMRIDMLQIAAAGNVVLTERIDRIIGADGTESLAIRLMGVLEVEDGKIINWRDYFDTAALAAPAPRIA